MNLIRITQDQSLVSRLLYGILKFISPGLIISICQADHEIPLISQVGTSPDRFIIRVSYDHQFGTVFKLKTVQFLHSYMGRSDSCNISSPACTCQKYQKQKISPYFSLILFQLFYHNRKVTVLLFFLRKRKICSTKKSGIFA